MPAAILMVTLGGLMIYSALKGESIVDVFRGVTGTPLNPKGGYDPNRFAGGATGDISVLGDTGGTNAPDLNAATGSWNAPPGGAHSFKGPHATLLNALASNAQNTYHLTITATTNGGHVPGSYHYQGRAFDAAGSEANMHAFADFVETNFTPQLAELIHNPGFAVDNGRKVLPAVFAAVWEDHRNHVHVAA